VATLPTDLLHIVQIGGDEIWLHGPDALIFDRQPVHVFVLEPDTGQAPAALILTTQAEPGNPECHRASPPVRYLDRSYETEQLAFIPRDQIERIRENINEAEDVLMDTLWGENHALDVESGVFCVWRYQSRIAWLTLRQRHPRLPDSGWLHAPARSGVCLFA